MMGLWAAGRRGGFYRSIRRLVRLMTILSGVASNRPIGTKMADSGLTLKSPILEYRWTVRHSRCFTKRALCLDLDLARRK